MGGTATSAEQIRARFLRQRGGVYLPISNAAMAKKRYLERSEFFQSYRCLIVDIEAHAHPADGRRRQHRHDHQLRKSAIHGDDAGSSAVGFGPFVNAGKAGGANNSEFLSLVGTVDYALWANVISRAEIRWDSDVSGSSGAGGVFGGAANEKNAVTVALNVIYKF